MLKAECIQFCDGLSTPGNCPTAASGYPKPPLKQSRFQQAHLQLHAGRWCVLGVHLGVWFLQPDVLDKRQVRKSGEGCPDISSLIWFNLPLFAWGGAAPACWHGALTQSVLTRCLFIIQLLELLDVLMAYYPLGTFTSRIGKTYSSLISVTIKKWILTMKHCFCFTKLFWHVHLFKPRFSF